MPVNGYRFVAKFDKSSFSIWQTFSTFHIAVAQNLCQWCGQRWFLSNHEYTLHFRLRLYYLLFFFFFFSKFYLNNPMWLLLSVCLSDWLTHNHFICLRQFNAMLFISRMHETRHKSRISTRNVIKTSSACRLCSLKILFLCLSCNELNLTRTKSIKIKETDWIKRSDGETTIMSEPSSKDTVLKTAMVYVCGGELVCFVFSHSLTTLTIWSICLYDEAACTDTVFHRAVYSWWIREK